MKPLSGNMAPLYISVIYVETLCRDLSLWNLYVELCLEPLSKTSMWKLHVMKPLSETSLKKPGWGTFMGKLYVESFVEPGKC